MLTIHEFLQRYGDANAILASRNADVCIYETKWLKLHVKLQWGDTVPISETISSLMCRVVKGDDTFVVYDKNGNVIYKMWRAK